MTRLTRIALGVLTAAAAARSAQGQASFNADVGLNSQFVWRGVTSTNRFVIQPDLSISTPVSGLTFTAGLWGNIEPVRYDGARDLSSLGGLPGPLVTQSEMWVTLERTFRDKLTASVGSSAYLYPHVGGLNEYNTVELQVSATIDADVSPSVLVAYDVARIRGAYIETGLSRAITGDRLGALTLGVVTAFSAGQAEDPAGRDLAYYERDGLTHVDASASASFTVGRFTVAPEAHVIFGHDALARVTAPDVTRRTKLWFGSTVSWTTTRDNR